MHNMMYSFEALALFYGLRPQVVRSVCSVRRLPGAPMGSATAEDFGWALACARGLNGRGILSADEKGLGRVVPSEPGISAGEPRGDVRPDPSQHPGQEG